MSDGAKSKKAGSCHIFLGPELGKKQSALEAVRKSLAPGGGVAESPGGASAGAVDETVFYAGETPALQMAAAIQNGSLFAEARLFLIKSAELIKKKDEIDILAACARQPGEGTALIFVSENNSIAKGLEDAVPKENRRVFYELFENEKTEWLASFFGRGGFTVDAEGIEVILELVENNTEALERECSRLMLFFAEKKTIGASDLEEWLSHSREESAFTLFSGIAAGDFPRSLESLHALLGAKESFQRILAGLALCFRRLRDYLALAERGEVNNFELKKIGIAAPKARNDYAAASRIYSAAGADACLALTAEYDILLRSSGSALESILMDRYLYKIFRAGADPTQPSLASMP
ncbi:MAG: DNA polymerase III subunit delta [Treponema sp.]|jgi:DNA polymerase-3 subunit delta|nr:DNA polymerase III subunit delta [Treponema sp.]